LSRKVGFLCRNGDAAITQKKLADIGREAAGEKHASLVTDLEEVKKKAQSVGAV
jgi:hypothetical protein